MENYNPTQYNLIDMHHDSILAENIGDVGAVLFLPIEGALYSADVIRSIPQMHNYFSGKGMNLSAQPMPYSRIGHFSDEEMKKKMTEQLKLVLDLRDLTGGGISELLLVGNDQPKIIEPSKNLATTTLAEKQVKIVRQNDLSRQTARILAEFSKTLGRL